MYFTWRHSFALLFNVVCVWLLVSMNLFDGEKGFWFPTIYDEKPSKCYLSNSHYTKFSLLPEVQLSLFLTVFRLWILSKLHVVSHLLLLLRRLSIVDIIKQNTPKQMTVVYLMSIWNSDNSTSRTKHWSVQVKYQNNHKKISFSSTIYHF